MTKLIDPISGSEVHIKIAELPQKCGLCREQMLGQYICRVEHSGKGWTCMCHLERLTMTLPMSPRTRAQRQAQRELADVVVGQTVVATRPLLAALS